MTHYVLGFLFSPTNKEVVLIEKNKPEWQKGKLNGVGGKIEPGESSIDAMRREFREETGLEIAYWRKLLRMEGKDWTCEVFSSNDARAEYAMTCTDEVVRFVEVQFLTLYNCIHNVPWLVHLVLDEQTPPGQLIKYY